MLPYRPSQIFKKESIKYIKLKPIPSNEFIYALNILCEGTQNTYDPKNHILTINQLSIFENKLKNIFNRTFKYFEKQLKLLGYKLRKYRYNQEQNDENENQQVRVYKWKGKKQQLIDEQLNYISNTLSERKKSMQQAQQIIKNGKKIIDQQIQSIIFSIIVDPKSSKVIQSLNSILGKTKFIVNQSQASVRKIIDKISSTLSNQLQLYKLLIYKQGNQEKRIIQKQGDGEDQNQGQGDNGIPQQQQMGSQGNQEEQKRSAVSISVDKSNKQQQFVKKVQNQ